MKFSLQILEKFYSSDQPLSIEFISKALTEQGCEIEGMFSYEEHLKEVLVAYIQDVSPHPRSEKLKICQVKADRHYQVICGGDNVTAQQWVAFIPPNAQVGDLKIECKEILGVTSEGMIAAREELGLQKSKTFDNPKSIWDLSDPKQGGTTALRPEDTGRPLTSVITDLKDIILEIGITPNRIDLFSHEGMAREIVVAAQSRGLKITWTPWSFKTYLPSHMAEAHLIDNQLKWPCVFVEGHLLPFEQVDWAFFSFCRNQLEKLHKPSIHPALDASLLGTIIFGQPIHIYDRNRLGEEIPVLSAASESASFLGLDGHTYHLTSQDHILHSPNGPECLLGIMGGERSKIDGHSQTFLLELLSPPPHIVRQSSRRLGVISDSSLRFERGVNPFLLRKQVEEQIGLLRKMRIISDQLKIHYEVPTPTPIHIPDPTKEVERLSGLKLDQSRVHQILTALGLVSENGLFEVPIWRLDLKEKEDLVEEVLRVHGLDHIAPKPFFPFKGQAIGSPSFTLNRQVRVLLRSLGYTETPSADFISDRWFKLLGIPQSESIISIQNPLSQDMSIVPFSLIPLLWEHFVNLQNRLESGGALFMLEKTFSRQNVPSHDRGVVLDPHDPFHHERPSEQTTLAGLCFGERQESSWNQAQEMWSLPSLIRDLKHLFESFGCQLELTPGHSLPSLEPFTHPKSQTRLHLRGPKGELIEDFGWAALVRPSTYKKWKIKTRDVLILWEIPLGKILDIPLQIDQPEKAKPYASALTTFLALEKDLSLKAPLSCSAQNILKWVEEGFHAYVQQSGEHIRLERVHLFDYQQHEKDLTYGIRLKFRPLARSLNDQNIQELLKFIVEFLEKHQIYLKLGHFA